MRKKIAALFMAIVMTASLGVNAMAAYNASLTPVPLRAANAVKTQTFNDVPLTHWAFDYIDKVSYAGMINGLTPTWYGPSDNMTRAQFVTVLSRMEGQGALEGVTTQTAFSDVDPANRFAGPIKWATDKGIVQGYSDGTFRPTQAISRAQFAAMIHRYIVYKNYDQTDARGNYLKNGYGKEKRLSLVTEMNATLRSALGFQEGDPVPAVFSDTNLVSEVFTGDVEYARVRGLIQGFSDGTLRPNIAINRGQIAAILGRFMSVLGGSDNTVAYTPFLDGEDPRNPINYVRRSGGGGGSSGGTPTLTNSFATSNMYGPNAVWGGNATYKYTVKFVAVDASSEAVLTTTALLYDIEVPAANEPPLTLSSDTMANAASHEGIKLQINNVTDTDYVSAPTQIEVFKENVGGTDGVYTVADAEASSDILLSASAYSVSGQAVSMTQTQFETVKNVTVVAKYTKNTAGPEPGPTPSSDEVIDKTVLTTFHFVPVEVNEQGNRTGDGGGSATFTEMVSNRTSNASTFDQSNAVYGMKIDIKPASGYEIYKDSATRKTAIDVYDTSNGSSDRTHKLTSYSLNGDTIIMEGDQIVPAGFPVTVKNGNLLTDVTVEVWFLKSTYEYEMSFNMVLESTTGVGFGLDTIYSFKSSDYLSGGTPIKDAARLMLDDGPDSDSNLATDNDGDEVDNNAARLENTITMAITQIIVNDSTNQGLLTKHHNATADVKEYDGYRLDLEMFGMKSVVDGMVGGAAADALNTMLPNGDLNDQILPEIHSTLNSKITGTGGMYETLFNTAKAEAEEKIRTELEEAEEAGVNVSVSVQGSRFWNAETGGSQVQPSAWVDAVNDDSLRITMGSTEDKRMTASDVEAVSEKSFIILTKVAGQSQIAVKPDFDNLDVTLKALKGDYAITIPMGELFLEVRTQVGSEAPETKRVSISEYLANQSETANGVTAAVSANGQQMNLTGSFADVSLPDGGVTVNNVESQLGDTADLKLPMQDILFGEESPITRAFTNFQEKIRTNVKNADPEYDEEDSDSASAQKMQQVITKLDDEILSKIQLSEFVSVSSSTSNNVSVNMGLTGRSSANYRDWVVDFYDRFWNFHSYLFSVYPGDGSDADTNMPIRQAMLEGVLEPILEKVGGRGQGQVAKVAKLLASDTRPTIASLYDTLEDIASATVTDYDFAADTVKPWNQNPARWQGLEWKDLQIKKSFAVPAKASNLMEGFQIGEGGYLNPEFHFYKRQIPNTQG